VDLGLSPIANAFPTPEEAQAGERFFPLRAFVCDRCKLVQLEDFETREAHFRADYPYFSSFSSTWQEHCRRFADMATERFRLTEKSFVVEVASNDGCLLRHFVKRGVPALGIDPAAECAEAAKSQYGVETDVAFFGRDTAERLRGKRGAADLVVANNVLAHVPDLNDFVSGLASLLKPEGIATIEFPHVLELIARNEFDTIYHEHYSYLSLLALAPLFARHGLSVVDVEKLPTHGSSLRLYVTHQGSAIAPSEAVGRLADEERSAGLDSIETYLGFGERAKATKGALLSLLTGLKHEGRAIAGCGAPAKATTLLNYCGIGAGILDFTVDRNPMKQGRLVPGTRIPIFDPDHVRRARPDYLMVLPWNISEELMAEFADIRDWGGRFVIPIPEPVIVQ
jgi:2-polyprenyl-3-methyl-5-hydroxy-6-metoxy-1,4-benzoquinol methylase